MAYTTIDDPSAYFHTQLYTGDGSSSNAITNDANAGDFKPDWLWIKCRSDAQHNQITDSTRGGNIGLRTNADIGEFSGASTQFDSDGFTLTDTSNVINGSSKTYVAWQWKANGGTTSTNNDGSVAVTLQTNTTAGFSIGTYTGTGSQLTLGHGLGVAPKVHLTKKRSSADAWNLYHESNGNTHGLRLNGNQAKEDFGFYGDTSPTSSVFTVGGVTSNDRLNTNGGTYIFYSFAEVKGYSKFGSYTGNGNADGTFVYTGFKPAWLLIKRTSNTQNWFLQDNKRNSNFNPNKKTLFPNSSSAEDGAIPVDHLSNGFKTRSTDTVTNNSGDTYIYMAFAEHPFVSSKGVPTTAR